MFCLKEIACLTVCSKDKEPHPSTATELYLQLIEAKKKKKFEQKRKSGTKASKIGCVNSFEAKRRVKPSKDSRSGTTNKRRRPETAPQSVT